MENYLKDELTDCQTKLIKARDKSDDVELKATLDNVLTPVVVLLDELEHDKQPNFEEMACEVLCETRKRMAELIPPDTLRSGEVPMEIPPARDTEPCNMETVLRAHKDPFSRCMDIETMEIGEKSDLFTKIRHQDR